MKIEIRNIFKKKEKKKDNKITSENTKPDNLIQFQIKKSEKSAALIDHTKKPAKVIQNVSPIRTGRKQEKKEVSEERQHLKEEMVEPPKEVPREIKRKGAVCHKQNSKTKTMAGNLFANKNKLSKGYYFLLFAMVGLGTASVVLTAKAYRMFQKEDYSVYGSADSGGDIAVSSSIQTTDPSPEALESDNATNNQDTRKTENTTQTEKKTTTTTKATATKKQETPKVVPLSFAKPLQGEILKIYSSDKVLYSKTLELWKTHDGIDIKADIGQSVKAIEKGVVEKVYDDSFYGTTVVIDHGQGYKSSYSNLDNNVPVAAKQSVTKGKVIGKVSNTAIGEIKDDPHLHFMLFKDNKNVDPTYIFK